MSEFNVDGIEIYPEMDVYGGFEDICNEIATRGMSKQSLQDLNMNYGGDTKIDIDGRKLTTANSPVSAIALEALADILQFVPTTYAEENGDIVTVSGLPVRLLVKRIYTLWNTNRVAKNIFIKTAMRYFTFNRFFAVEVVYLLQEVIKLPNISASKATLQRAIDEIIENTWISKTRATVIPPRFNYKKLDELNLPMMKHQLDFLSQYERNTYLYGLNGYVLASPPGSGKTLTGYAMSLVCEPDVTLIIAPNNSIVDVWEKELLTRFKDPEKYPYWHSHMNANPTGKEKYIIIHYEYLLKIDHIIQRFKNKKWCVWLDECHNFNEIASLRTQRLVDLVRDELDTVTYTAASGTPWKSTGKEVVPVMRIIDPLFSPKVEERFVKVFGASRGAALEMLSHRIGIIQFIVPKIDVVNNEKTYYIQPVSFKGMEEYTLEKISAEIRKFVTERKAYYASKRMDYEMRYAAVINAAQQQMDKRELNELSIYKSGTLKMHTNFDPQGDIELIRACKAYEREYIIPVLCNADKKEFRHVSSVYKYVSLTIIGEALGRILTRARINCFKAMVPHSNLPDIIRSARKKTLIFTSYVEVADEISEYLADEGFEPLIVYGATNAQLPAILKEYRDDPKANPIVATFDSLSTAVPVTDASTVIMFNSPFREYIRNQAISRSDRLGQDGCVDIVDIILDTGKEDNISSRSVDILKWSKENVDKMMGIDSADVEKIETIALESFDAPQTTTAPTVDMYHISFDPDLPSVLKPQLPAGSDLRSDGASDYREPEIPRVCFSGSLVGCVRAVYPNIQQVAESYGTKGMTVTVYRAEPMKGKWVTSNTLTEKRLVHDAIVTGEFWALSPITIEKIGTMVVKLDPNGEFLTYHPFGDTSLKVEEHSPKDIDIEIIKYL